MGMVDIVQAYLARAASYIVCQRPVVLDGLQLPLGDGQIGYEKQTGVTYMEGYSGRTR